MSNRRQINIRIDDEVDAMIDAIRRHLATVDIDRCSASDAIRDALKVRYDQITEQRPRKRAS